MQKAALTFAEIFIVLSLIFFVQMVVNFSLFEGESATPPPGFEIMSIRQVPSSGSRADHVTYLRFEAAGQSMHLQMKNSSSLREQDIGSFINKDGRCQSRPRVDPEKIKIHNWHLESSRESIQEQLLQKFGISFMQVDVSGVQPEYLLSWQPDALKATTYVTVGLEHCMINFSHDPSHHDHKSLHVHDAWNLGVNTLQFPHPLVVDRVAIGDFIERQDPQLFYAHSKSILDVKDRATMHQPTYKGIVFKDSINNCLFKHGKMRTHIAQEVQLELQPNAN